MRQTTNWDVRGALPVAEVGLVGERERPVGEGCPYDTWDTSAVAGTTTCQHFSHKSQHRCKTVVQYRQLA